MTTAAMTQPAPTTAVAKVDDSETGLDSSAGFATLQRVATMFSASSLVPEAFRGNLPNCAIAVHMALRMKADPLMVMQNLYVVHGRPGWSSQFLIATFNQCGRFSALRYEWSGEQGKDDWGCAAWAVEKTTGEKLYGSKITIALAKSEGWHGKNGSKWKSMPQQMLMYRAAAFFIRAYAPELAMGLPTADEAEDIAPDASARVVVTSATTNVEHKSKSDELAALAKPADVVEAATTGEESQEQPDGVLNDAVPYWLGIITEAKDQSALMRKHEQFDSIRADLSTEQQEQIEQAFADRLTALTTAS